MPHVAVIFIHKYTLSKTEVDMRKTVLCGNWKGYVVKHNYVN